MGFWVEFLCVFKRFFLLRTCSSWDVFLCSSLFLGLQLWLAKTRGLVVLSCIVVVIYMCSFSNKYSVKLLPSFLKKICGEKLCVCLFGNRGELFGPSVRCRPVLNCDMHGLGRPSSVSSSLHCLLIWSPFPKVGLAQLRHSQHSSNGSFHFELFYFYIFYFTNF